MSTIITHTGKLIDVCNPRPEDIDITDISHALGNICRWAGHSSRFFSVAQHSVIVSDQVSPENALWGLLHDAAEAYLMDIPTPLKKLWPAYKKLEDAMQKVIFECFGLSGEMPAEVKLIDKRVQATEAIELGLRPHLWQGLSYDPLPLSIDALSSSTAGHEFYMRWWKLTH